MKKNYNIYVDSMARYNAGEMQGGWIKLPIEDEELKLKLTELNIKDNDEIAVLDIDSDYEFTHNLHMSSTVGIHNAMAKAIEIAEKSSACQVKFDTVKALMDEGIATNSIYDAMHILIFVETHVLGRASGYGYTKPNHIISKEEALGCILFDYVHGDEDISETIQSYIDYNYVYETLRSSMPTVEVPIKNNDILLVKYTDFNEMETWDQINELLTKIDNIYSIMKKN